MTMTIDQYERTILESTEDYRDDCREAELDIMDEIYEAYESALADYEF